MKNTSYIPKQTTYQPVKQPKENIQKYRPKPPSIQNKNISSQPKNTKEPNKQNNLALEKNRATEAGEGCNKDMEKMIGGNSSVEPIGGKSENRFIVLEVLSDTELNPTTADTHSRKVSLHGKEAETYVVPAGSTVVPHMDEVESIPYNSECVATIQGPAEERQHTSTIYNNYTGESALMQSKLSLQPTLQGRGLAEIIELPKEGSSVEIQGVVDPNPETTVNQYNYVPHESPGIHLTHSLNAQTLQPMHYTAHSPATQISNSPTQEVYEKEAPSPHLWTSPVNTLDQSSPVPIIIIEPSPVKSTGLSNPTSYTLSPPYKNNHTRSNVKPMDPKLNQIDPLTHPLIDPDSPNRDIEPAIRYSRRYTQIAIGREEMPITQSVNSYSAPTQSHFFDIINMEHNLECASNQQPALSNEINLLEIKESAMGTRRNSEPAISSISHRKDDELEDINLRKKTKGKAVAVRTIATRSSTKNITGIEDDGFQDKRSKYEDVWTTDSDVKI